MLKIYEGDPETNQVTVDGQPLAMRRELRDYAGMYEWGYPPHPGTSQLSLALLCDHMGDPNRALRYVVEFKWQVLVKQFCAGISWTLTSAQIDEAIAKIDRQIAKEARRQGEERAA